MSDKKLCMEIQRTGEQSIIKIVEDYLSKRNKNENNNTKAPNAKPKFTPRLPPREKLSPPSIHQSSLTNSNTSATTVTKHPTDVSKYTTNYHITPKFPHNNNAILDQPSTNHLLKCTYTHTHIIYQPPLFYAAITYALMHTSHDFPTTAARISPTDQENPREYRKSNYKNYITNAIHETQHTTPKSHMRHDQANASKPQHITIPTTGIITVPHSMNNCSMNRSIPLLWTSSFITVVCQYKTSTVNYLVNLPVFIENYIFTDLPDSPLHCVL